MLTVIHAKEKKLKRERREKGEIKIEHKIGKTKNEEEKIKKYKVIIFQNLLGVGRITYTLFYLDTLIGSFEGKKTPRGNVQN